MAKYETRWDKASLVDTRDALIHILADLNYSGQDIADLFAIHRSTVSRTLSSGKEMTIVKVFKKITKKIRK
jgi:predicted transcriptional regulator